MSGAGAGRAPGTPLTGTAAAGRPAISVRDVRAGFRDDHTARAAAVWFWLDASGSPHTREAYRRDIAQWFGWCDASGVPPGDARRADVDAWRGELGAAGLAGATIARKLSAVSSFYAYWLAEDAVERNPAKNARRPRQSGEPKSITLTRQQAAQLLAYADSLPDTRPAVIVRLLAETGMRISELCSARAEHLAMDGGHHVLMITRKGGRPQALPIAPATRARVGEHLGGRRDGFIVRARRTGPAAAGGGRLDRKYVWRLLRRLAAGAGLPEDVVSKLHPHVLRASCATIAAADGVPHHEIQRMLGHADPRTTAGYIRHARGLDASPVYRVAAAIAPVHGPP